MSDVNIMGGDADPEALAHPQPLFKMLRDAGPIVDLGEVDAGEPRRAASRPRAPG